MTPKQEKKSTKRERDTKVLIILGSVALCLMVLSITALLNSKGEDLTLPANGNQQSDNPTMVREEGAGESDDAPSTEENPTESGTENGEDVPNGEEGSSIGGDPTSEQAEPNEGKGEDSKPNVTSGLYTSERLQVTFDIPSSWEGLVDMHESENGSTIEFLYKEDYLFLSLRAVTQLEYDENKGYFDSFYKVVLKNKNLLVMYALPNEHPLAHDEGSQAFQELNAVMTDNYNLIKTIKAK